MEVVNPFILKNKERMVVFLDHLSSVREKPYPDEVLLTSSIAQSACLAVKQSAYERPTPSSIILSAGPSEWRPCPGPRYCSPHL